LLDYYQLHQPKVLSPLQLISQRSLWRRTFCQTLCLTLLLLLSLYKALFQNKLVFSHFHTDFIPLICRKPFFHVFTLVGDELWRWIFYGAFFLFCYTSRRSTCVDVTLATFGSASCRNPSDISSSSRSSMSLYSQSTEQSISSLSILIKLMKFSMHVVAGEPPQIVLSLSQLSQTILPLPDLLPSPPAFR